MGLHHLFVTAGEVGLTCPLCGLQVPWTSLAGFLTLALQSVETLDGLPMVYQHEDK